MAEAKAYQQEDGSPGVRYPRESRLSHTCTHLHAHTTTQTHKGRVTRGVDTQHTIRGHHQRWAPTTLRLSASAQRGDKLDN